ncbi:SMP-30/gluconolactonase/LRE family protein [Massilia pseudoviolaceinigra]|uniref:SMP-30/gluconolactonase/LRE family protein n=1 Tax=Massilia pseudoviolaceinigra TaxID=3057165 RepID=UPI0027969B7D|nr:SMP-30/gluconolactonase/LRE family protein [Massilia sp. CCM 9206]MDQ1923886.1 SMP-30/gluconolactonase/LRE family protein [Massilia sp. CCM 9206]
MTSLNGKYKKPLVIAAAIGAIGAGGIWYALQPGGQPAVRKVAAMVGIKPQPTVLGWPVSIGTVAGSSGSAGFADGAAAQARFSDPFGLVIDRDGNVFVADAGENNRIRKITPEGVVSTLAGRREGFADGTGAAAGFHTPSGIAIDAAGNLFVADTGNNAVRKITPSGVVSTIGGTGVAGYRDGKAGEAQFNGPVGVAVDKAGVVYVADTYNDRIRKIALDGTVSTLAGGAPGYVDGPAAAAQFDTPTSVVVDATGNLYVADTSNGAVRKLAPDGQVITLAIAPEDAEKPLLRRPVGLALTHDGFLYVGDIWRGRILQVSPDGSLRGLTGIGVDIDIGDDKSLRLSRPSAIALDRTGALYVADAVKRTVHRVSPRLDGATAVLAPKAPALVATGTAPVAAASTASQPVAAALPAPAAPAAAGRFPWPFKPQDQRHEVVGTIGEVRGSYGGESRHHFHSGLDVQANMGVPVLAVADEKVSSPVPNWAFGDVGEGMSVDSMAYIHMRVGRTVKDAPLDPARFIMLDNEKGKAARMRVKRGTRFHVGEALGTVNRMFHVHLVYQPGGAEANPLTLPFTGFSDQVAPRIDKIQLVDAAGTALARKPGKRVMVARGTGPLGIVVDAYDQADGNAARRKLGLYKVGYQVLQADGTPVAGFDKPLINIEFNKLPPDPESVKLAYADNSGITVYGSATTRFLYVVTNTVRDGVAKTGGWDPAALAPGDYLIRIFAADYVGNEALNGRDLPITVE